MIFFIDFIKDGIINVGGEDAAEAEALQEMMVCISVVIGFAWEHAFMIGLKALDQDLNKNGGMGSPGGLDIVGMILSILMIMVVMPAWRWFPGGGTVGEKCPPSRIKISEWTRPRDS